MRVHPAQIVGQNCSVRGSEMEVVGGAGVCGGHSHLSEQLSWVLCVWSPSGAAYTNDPLSALSSPWHHGFY